MRTSKEMADLIFQIRDSTVERKKSKHKRIMYVVKYAAPAAACFGLAITISASYLVKYSKMPDVEVQPANSIISDNTDTTASNNSKTSSTTVVTDNRVSATTAKAGKFVSAKVSAEQDTEHDAMTEVTSVSEESLSAVTDTEVTVETQAPAVTRRPVQTVTEVTTHSIDYGETTEHTMPHLLDSDDPITIFRNITFDGKDYEGYKYINGLREFYILWTEETELMTYDAKRKTDVAEPVTIYGIRNNLDNQEYLIVRFTEYNIYALYWAVEEEDKQPTDSQ